MVSATNTNCLLDRADLERANLGRVTLERAAVERGGVRTIGEVLAEMLPQYASIAETNARPQYRVATSPRQ